MWMLMHMPALVRQLVANTTQKWREDDLHVLLGQHDSAASVQAAHT
jgi:hypothetical protein